MNNELGPKMCDVYSTKEQSSSIQSYRLARSRAVCESSDSSRVEILGQVRFHEVSRRRNLRLELHLSSPSPRCRVPWCPSDYSSHNPRSQIQGQQVCRSCPSFVLNPASYGVRVTVAIERSDDRRTLRFILRDAWRSLCGEGRAVSAEPRITLYGMIAELPRKHRVAE